MRKKSDMPTMPQQIDKKLMQFLKSLKISEIDDIQSNSVGSTQVPPRQQCVKKIQKALGICPECQQKPSESSWITHCIRHEQYTENSHKKDTNSCHKCKLWYGSLKAFQRHNNAVHLTAKQQNTTGNFSPKYKKNVQRKDKSTESSSPISKKLKTN
jgi:hypothetical protein